MEEKQRSKEINREKEKSEEEIKSESSSVNKEKKELTSEKQKSQDIKKEEEKMDQKQEKEKEEELNKLKKKFNLSEVHQENLGHYNDISTQTKGKNNEDILGPKKELLKNYCEEKLKENDFEDSFFNNRDYERFLKKYSTNLESNENEKIRETSENFLNHKNIDSKNEENESLQSISTEKNKLFIPSREEEKSNVRTEQKINSEKVLEKNYDYQLVEELNDFSKDFNEKTLEIDARIKGNISELKFLKDLVKNDIKTFTLYGDAQHYDLIIENNNKFSRIQIKTGTFNKDGSIVFSPFRTCKGQFKSYEGEIDYFGIFCPKNNKSYLVPMQRVGHINNFKKFRIGKDEQEKFIIKEGSFIGDKKNDNIILKKKISTQIIKEG